MSVKSLAFSWKTREEAWARLSSEIFDLVIIGGGITGAACARDASLRGLKTLLVESADFASGTSSASSKLIHGGVRYLKNFEFSLVYTAIRERERLKKLYAPFVQPIPFVFPTYARRFPQKWMLNMGLHLYDGFSGFNERHENLSKKETLARYPHLRGDALTGSIVYSDSFAEDYRLVIEVIKSAHRHGALCVNQVAAVSIQSQSSRHEIRLQDRLQGRECQVKAKAILNAAGPFADHIRRMLGLPDRLYLTQGVHFLIPRSVLPIQEAYVLSDPDHDRILFAIPWNSTTYLGTTDTALKNPQDAQAHEEDLLYVLRLASQTFQTPIPPEAVFQSWAGVRPLLKPQEVTSNSKVSREHELSEEPQGVFHLLGGKLTSHREMAEEALTQICDRLQKGGACTTEQIPLQDEFFSKSNPSDLEKRYGIFASDVLQIDSDRALRDARISKSLPHLVAEVLYSIEHEMALFPLDFLRRRSSIYYESTDPKILEVISRVFQKELSWSENVTASEIEKAGRVYEWDVKAWKNTVKE